LISFYLVVEILIAGQNELTADHVFRQPEKYPFQGTTELFQVAYGFCLAFDQRNLPYLAKAPVFKHEKTVLMGVIRQKLCKRPAFFEKGL
jgi:hypothetical protein